MEAGKHIGILFNFICRQRIEKALSVIKSDFLKIIAEGNHGHPAVRIGFVGPEGELFGVEREFTVH